MSNLLVCATQREVRALEGLGVEARVLGVGKTTAAINTSAAIAQARPEAVLLFGVCGAYPTKHVRAGLGALSVLDPCVVTREVYADEGVMTPDGFIDLPGLGLEAAGPFDADAERSAAIAKELGCPEVVGATVSTGAGVDALSQAYALRSGAQIETLEGASVAQVCQRAEVPFVQLRVVSNRTGDRNFGGWDLAGAVSALADALGKLQAANLL